MCWRISARASVALGSFLVMTVALALSATAQPPAGEDTVDDEILVLLRPGPDHPGPEEVVEAINAGRTPIPGGLGEGNPHLAELVIRNRARGAARERLLADPDEPRARLERTIVLHYESAAAVPGLVLRNRLTVFFALYSSFHTVHLYTTSPQRAAAAVVGNDGVPFSPIGTAVPAYQGFPGVAAKPRASVFLFTTPNTPLGQTFTLLPLYRLSKDPFRQELCTDVPGPGAQWSFAYASSASEILSLRNDGYALNGIEGYVIDPAGPLPAGSILLHRLYNPSLDDWVVVPTSEVSSLPAGYGPRAGINEIVGAAFPNVDSDGDAVINGFETMIGTNALAADSDGDGVNDGDEILGYTGATPSGILGDPLCSVTSCLFADGFETGDTSRWSSVVP